jgi:hypothetical protein
MGLNQINLRAIFANIFNVDSMYIIPKMGVWFNPQSMLPTATKPLTWIAYKILSNKPVTVPWFNFETVTVGQTSSLHNFAKTYKIATVDLQFVGTRAESLANGISFWLLRDDVKIQLETVSGKLMADDWEVKTADFFQDGNNNILSYNVRIRIMWLDAIQTTHELAEGVELTQGEII